MTTTEKITHTPGPWKIDTDGTTIIAPLGFSIPGTDGMPAYMAIARQVADCNANLIAAAPELLEALDATLARMDELQQHTNYPGEWPRVLAAEAIAKARGE